MICCILILVLNVNSNLSLLSLLSSEMHAYARTTVAAHVFHIVLPRVGVDSCLGTNVLELRKSHPGCWLCPL